MLMAGKYCAIDKYLEEKYERKSILAKCVKCFKADVFAPYSISYQRGFGISKFGFKTLRATSGSFYIKSAYTTSFSFSTKTFKAISGSFFT